MKYRIKQYGFICGRSTYQVQYRVLPFIWFGVANLVPDWFPAHDTFDTYKDAERLLLALQLQKDNS
jgi:hypothetical protein